MVYLSNVMARPRMIYATLQVVLTRPMRMARRSRFSNPIFKLPLVSSAILTTLLCFSTASMTLEAFAQSTTSSPPVTIETDNSSVKVIVNWSPTEIQTGQNVDFSLEFQNPSSGQDFSHVNYDLKFIDSTSGKVIRSVNGIHTHSGKDVQSVTFETVGNFRLEITVIGLGLTQPFDTSKSGTVQTSLVVVPEFPFALAMLAVGGVIAILLTRYTRLFGLSKSSTAIKD